MCLQYYFDLYDTCVSADSVCERGLYGVIGRNPSEASSFRCAVQLHELHCKERICSQDL